MEVRRQAPDDPKRKTLLHAWTEYNFFCCIRCKERAVVESYYNSSHHDSPTTTQFVRSKLFHRHRTGQKTRRFTVGRPVALRGTSYRLLLVGWVRAIHGPNASLLRAAADGRALPTQYNSFCFVFGIEVEGEPHEPRRTARGF